MKRLVFALALVAAVGACKKAEQPPAAATDSSSMMMSDSAKMAAPADTSKMMDTTKH
jgi:hypothetical protein